MIDTFVWELLQCPNAIDFILILESKAVASDMIMAMIGTWDMINDDNVLI